MEQDQLDATPLVDQITSRYTGLIAALRLEAILPLLPPGVAAAAARAAALTALKSSPSLNAPLYRALLGPTLDDGWAAATEAGAAALTADLERRIVIESSTSIRDQQRVRPCL